MEQQVLFGITTPQHHVTYPELLRVWQAADELGFDSAWLFDHFLPIAGDVEGPCLEAMVTLAALAVQTQRLRVGTLVLANTYRHPTLLANMGVALDLVSNGRLELGLGAAWYAREHQAYGIPFPSTATRIRMMGEALQVVKLLWTESKVNFQGRYYTLTDALCQPKPIQRPHPPLWVGGGGERLTLRILAEHADGWDYMAPLPEYGRKLQVLADHCRAVGRDIQSIQKAIHFVLGIDYDRQRAESKAVDAYLRFGIPAEEVHQSAIIGTPDECIEHLRQYMALGVSHFIIELRPPYDYEGMELFMEKVIPAFR